MTLILWLALAISPAFAQKPCELAKYKLPISIAGNNVSFDESKFTLEEHPTADNSRRGLSILPRGASWRHLTLTAKDSREGPYDFYFQVSDGALIAVDTFTESEDSVKRLRFTNENGTCTVDNYIVSNRQDYVLYSRLACESLKKITETKTEDRKEQDELERAKVRVISRERISISEGNGRMRLVNPTSMSDLIKYIDVCKSSSSPSQEATPIIPTKGRPAPIRQPTPDSGTPSST